MYAYIKMHLIKSKKEKRVNRSEVLALIIEYMFFFSIWNFVDSSNFNIIVIEVNAAVVVVVGIVWLSQFI